MAKEKDVHVTNNINIKLDGEKKKKKRKSRKGKHKKSKKRMASLGDDKQYPHTGQIYATGVPTAQPPPKPEEDYHKHAEDYLGGKQKNKALAITDKERPLAIKDADKKTDRSFFRKPEALLESYEKRISKGKKKAVILSEEYLGDPKNISIKKLKELMIEHGINAENLKPFTRESQRKKAVELFLKSFEPEEPTVTHTETYKSPLKTSHKSPMKNSKTKDIKEIRSDYDTLARDTVKLFSPAKSARSDAEQSENETTDDEKLSDTLDFTNLMGLSMPKFKEMAISFGYPRKDLSGFTHKRQQLEFVNKVLKFFDDQTKIPPKTEQLPDFDEEFKRQSAMKVTETPAVAPKKFTSPMKISATPAPPPPPFRETKSMTVSETPVVNPRLVAVDPSHHKMSDSAHSFNPSLPMVMGTPFSTDQIAHSNPFTVGGLSVIKEHNDEDRDEHPYVDMRRGRGSDINPTPVRKLEDETPRRGSFKDNFNFDDSPEKSSVTKVAGGGGINFGRRKNPLQRSSYATPIHGNVETKRGGGKVREPTPLGALAEQDNPEHPFEKKKGSDDEDW